MLVELFELIQDAKPLFMLIDHCQEHQEEAKVKCIDCDMKLCIEWIWSDIHKGHNLRPLKQIYSEALLKTHKAKSSLKQYQKAIEESETALKVVKILKEDTASTAVNSVITQIKV